MKIQTFHIVMLKGCASPIAAYLEWETAELWLKKGAYYIVHAEGVLPE